MNHRKSKNQRERRRNPQNYSNIPLPFLVSSYHFVEVRVEGGEEEGEGRRQMRRDGRLAKDWREEEKIWKKMRKMSRRFKKRNTRNNNVMLNSSHYFLYLLPPLFLP
jgi:hypothetical protein